MLGMCLKNPIAEPKALDWILAPGSFDRSIANSAALACLGATKAERGRFLICVVGPA